MPRLIGEFPNFNPQESHEIENSSLDQSVSPESFEAKVERAFLSLGRNVAAHPKKWMAGNIFFALLCFAGLFSPNMKVHYWHWRLIIYLASFPFPFSSSELSSAGVPL